MTERPGQTDNVPLHDQREDELIFILFIFLFFLFVMCLTNDWGQVLMITEILIFTLTDNTLCLHLDHIFTKPSYKQQNSFRSQQVHIPPSGESELRKVHIKTQKDNKIHLTHEIIQPSSFSPTNCDSKLNPVNLVLSKGACADSNHAVLLHDHSLRISVCSDCKTIKWCE